MHFSIPDTQELKDENGSIYIGYNVHINGVFHCAVRYKQLHNLHEQLKKEFGSDVLPYFPPKKILPLTHVQLEERRASLEKYVQTIAQDSRIVSSELVIGFLLFAQQETTCETKQEQYINIYILNDSFINIKVGTYDCKDKVLFKICKHLDLPSEYMHYFSLYLYKANTDELEILRKLLDFESPYMSHKATREPNKIVLRKNYWDVNYDLELMRDPIALNLLYIQTFTEVEKEWILSLKDTRRQLVNFQTRSLKKEYVELARSLKYYGYIQFKPCFCDYPKSQTRVLVAIGDQELNMRLVGPGQVCKEGSFKITRMRCWRITALHNKQDGPTISNSSHKSSLELSFEYLMSKDKLEWITITSEQAILMSICLQSLVDELVWKKNGLKKRHLKINRNWSYMKRDGSTHVVTAKDSQCSDNLNERDYDLLTNQDAFSIKKLQEKFSSVSFKSGKELIENHVFEGIGDDDL